MSHKCVRCGTSFVDNDNSILKGCTNCGSIFFLYLNSERDEKEAKGIEEELQQKETTLEKELTKKIEEKKIEIRIEPSKPKIKKFRKEKFGIETVRIPKEGVYKIDIEGLMEKKPLIVLEKGTIYLVHLPSVFETLKKEE